MYQTVIEAQARYLIEDRIRATRPGQSVRDRRRHRRLRPLAGCEETRRHHHRHGARRGGGVRHGCQVGHGAVPV